MRISEISLQCEDITWFGVDRCDHIFMCASGGCGCVPEFVCVSREETNMLENYFSKLPEATGALVSKGIDASEDAMYWAQKGLFSFDVDYDDNYGNSYIKMTSPIKPLQLSDLPEQIQNMLQNHVIDIDVSAADRLTVQHAYS